MVFQITFDQPYALWLLFSLPLLVFSHLYFMHHAKKRAIQFGNFHTIQRVTGKRILTKNILLLFVRCFIVILLILAAAGTTIWRDIPKGENDIILLIDTSASMSANDMAGTRLDAAKNIALDLVKNIKSTASIGVAQFSGLAQVIQPLTNDRDVASRAVQDVKMTTAGGTDISGAIYTAVNLLSTSQRGKSVVLMTDGVASISLFEESSIPKAIGYAQQNHVIVHTIGVGSHDAAGFIPGLDAETASLDEENLQTIANGTGGVYSWARDQLQLEDALKKIEANSGTAIIPNELSFGFLFCALIMLFVEWGLSNTRYRILP